MFIGEIRPFTFDFTVASKPGGKRPRGRTRVWTVHGNASGGIGSSSWAVGDGHELATPEETLPTIRPDPCRCAYYLPDIFLMVYDRADAQASNCEGRCVSRRVQIRFRKRIDIFWVCHGDFELAP